MDCSGLLAYFGLIIGLRLGFARFVSVFELRPTYIFIDSTIYPSFYSSPYSVIL